MPGPQSVAGHSSAWQAAYVAAAPEDLAQREFVAQLALPIREKETREQAERVAALRSIISNADERTASRLHHRLTTAGDSFGQLFHLTLHRATRSALIGELNSKSRGFDRGTSIQQRSTDNRTVPPRSTAPTKPIGGVPPQFVPPLTRSPTGTDIPVQVPTRPSVPWDQFRRNPNVITVPEGSDEPSWVFSALKQGLKGLGTVTAAGLGMVAIVGPAVGTLTIPAGVLAAALEEAWIAFQITEGGLAARYGAAGEAAARAVAAAQLGVNPALVRNLNDIKDAFPVVDFVSPKEIPSVKVRTIASALSGEAREAAARSAYGGDLLDLLGVGPGGDRKLEKAADALWENRRTLGRAWPTRLKSRDAVFNYLKYEAPLYIPDDHVQLMRQTRGKDLYRRLSSYAAYPQKLGLKTNKQISAFIQDQIWRYRPLGLNSAQFEFMAEVAAENLPADQVDRMAKQYRSLLKKRGRGGGMAL